MERILPGPNGDIAIPDRPGMGIRVDTQAIKKYLVPLEITVRGRTLYRTPNLE